MVANYPFCTIDPNVGVVNVPDDRLLAIAHVSQPEKLTPATMEFVDVAGLVRGAHQGEGLGNQFLSHIREVDVVVHVVRCFDDTDVTHVMGRVNPKDDVEIVETELLLKDRETIEKRMETTQRLLKTGDKKYRVELEILQAALDQVDRGEVLRLGSWPDDAWRLFNELRLLTAKPVIYAANVAEDDLEGESEGVARLREKAEAEGAEVVLFSAALEEEIARLEPTEAMAFLEDLGLEEPGLARLVRAAYRRLDVITFYTVKGPETRAWTIPRGTKAPQAAGRIHEDMERGFIRAETVDWKTFVEKGSLARIREEGLLRSEGKEYVVEDGDVVLFRFNV